MNYSEYFSWTDRTSGLQALLLGEDLSGAHGEAAFPARMITTVTVWMGSTGVGVDNWTIPIGRIQEVQRCPQRRPSHVGLHFFWFVLWDQESTGGNTTGLLARVHFYPTIDHVILCILDAQQLIGLFCCRPTGCCSGWAILGRLGPSAVRVLWTRSCSRSPNCRSPARLQQQPRRLWHSHPHHHGQIFDARPVQTALTMSDRDCCRASRKFLRSPC